MIILLFVHSKILPIEPTHMKIIKNNVISIKLQCYLINEWGSHHTSLKSCDN